MIKKAIGTVVAVSLVTTAMAVTGLCIACIEAYKYSQED